jgi:peptidoglycan/xylan/chitin deacetylase (PgdA/CDA1 family)
MLKKIVKKAFLYLGPLSLIRLIQRLRFGKGITILYGHRVLSDSIIADENDMRSITGHTSESEVIEAIKQLKKRFHIISMDQAIEQLSTGKVEQESAVLTFDDGFQDNFRYLYPVLKRHKVPATYYINASVIGTNKSLWFQSIINYFFAVESQQVDVAINGEHYDLSSPRKRYQAAFSFMQYIQANHKPQEFHRIIETLAGPLSLPPPDDQHMSWDELKQLAADPLITIGAHSYNHYPLGYCDQELSKFEIDQSIKQLEQNLEITIEHFSYPRGHKEDFNQHHIDCLCAMNIKSGVSTIRGVNRRGAEPFSLKRVGFPQSISEDVDDFLWHVAGVPQIVQSFRGK